MRIVILVGPKGCGKTTIGRWIADHWSSDGCSFLEVEGIAQQVLEARGGGGVMDKGYPKACFDAIHDAIEAQVDVDASSDQRFLVFETTGAAPETRAFLDDLRERQHVLLLVRIRASALTCADRIHNRDSTRQVPVSRELVERMHAATEALDWSWDLELQNDSEESLSRDDVVKEMQTILA